MTIALIIGYFVIWLLGINLVYFAVRAFKGDKEALNDGGLELISIVAGSLLIYWALSSFMPSVIGFLQELLR